MTVNAYVRKPSGTSTFTLFVRIGGVNTYSAALTTGTTSYLKVSYGPLTTKPGGAAWTWADITALEVGCRAVIGATAASVRVTQVYVDVVSSEGYFELSGFTSTPAAPLTIGFVDLKLKYNVPSATTDDSYKIQYAVDGSAWTDLQPAVSGANSKFDPAAIRPWAQIAEPTDGTWDWTDISNLKLRVYVTMGGAAWDSVSMTVFELWATSLPRSPTTNGIPRPFNTTPSGFSRRRPNILR